MEITITDDNILEPVERFSATLVSEALNVIVDEDRSNAVVTIFNDDSEFIQSQRNF